MKAKKTATLEDIAPKFTAAIRECCKTIDRIVDDAQFAYASCWNASRMIERAATNAGAGLDVLHVLQTALISKRTLIERNRMKAEEITKQIEKQLADLKL